MRIAFVADPLHPNTDRWASHLVVALGHQVHIFATSGLPEGDRPYSVTSVPSRNRLGYFFVGLQLRRLLRAVRPDVLIGYRIQSNGFAAALSGFHPLVLAAQTETIVWPPHSLAYRACVKFALKRADLVQAWNRPMAEHLLRLGTPRDRLLVLPRGVDTATFVAPAAPATGPVIVVTRALRKVYRHDTLIRAFRHVLTAVPESTLVIAGHGPEREALQELARDIGCAEQVEFAGGLSADRLALRLAKARCYAAIVATEGLSSSLLEAMSCGLVPVVADLPANREWIQHGVNGILLRPADLDDPIRVAEGLVRALQDDGLRDAAFAGNPPLVRQRADWKENLKTMECAYHRLVAGE